MPYLAVVWWLNRRGRRQEVREQLQDMEWSIWEEILPDWQREVIQDTRQRQAKIRREARRRLGLPEEK